MPYFCKFLTAYFFFCLLLCLSIIYFEIFCFSTVMEARWGGKVEITKKTNNAEQV